MAIDNIKLSQILEVGRVAARLAGQRAMELMGQTQSSKKSSAELVTQADVECQKIIMDRIRETFPDHGFLAEECDNDNLLKIPPRGEDFWWVIDPIDGTNNYVHGIPSFAISVGVISEGWPIAGVIFQPATEYMFTATANSDAQLNNSKITCGEEKIDCYAQVGLDSHFKDAIPEWQTKIMLTCRFRNFGSTASQMAYAANGGLVATATHYPKIWDIAAGYIIAKQAGCVISDWKGQPLGPFDLVNYKRESYKLLVGNSKAHKQMLELMNAFK